MRRRRPADCGAEPPGGGPRAAIDAAIVEGLARRERRLAVLGDLLGALRTAGLGNDDDALAVSKVARESRSGAMAYSRSEAAERSVGYGTALVRELTGSQRLSSLA